MKNRTQAFSEDPSGSQACALLTNCIYDPSFKDTQCLSITLALRKYIPPYPSTHISFNQFIWCVVYFIMCIFNICCFLSKHVEHELSAQSLSIPTAPWASRLACRLCSLQSVSSLLHGMNLPFSVPKLFPLPQPTTASSAKPGLFSMVLSTSLHCLWSNLQPRLLPLLTPPSPLHPPQGPPTPNHPHPKSKHCLHSWQPRCLSLLHPTALLLNARQCPPDHPVTSETLGCISPRLPWPAFCMFTQATNACPSSDYTKTCHANLWTLTWLGGHYLQRNVRDIFIMYYLIFLRHHLPNTYWAYQRRIGEG